MMMRAPTSILPVSVSDVSFVAGGRAIIDHVSFELAAGPRSVILGANGAGKSVFPAYAQDKFITVSSTTSTEQSGLFKHLLPVFEKRTGIQNVPTAEPESIPAAAGTVS